MNILEEEPFAEKKEKKVDYSLIFGDQEEKKASGRKGRPSRGSLATPRENGVETPPVKRITHPRFLTGSDHTVRILSQPSTPYHMVGSSADSLPRPPAPRYTCHLCGFVASRLGVIVLHTKSHSEPNHSSLANHARTSLKESNHSKGVGRTVPQRKRLMSPKGRGEPAKKPRLSKKQQEMKRVEVAGKEEKKRAIFGDWSEDEIEEIEEKEKLKESIASQEQSLNNDVDKESDEESIDDMFSFTDDHHSMDSDEDFSANSPKTFATPTLESKSLRKRKANLQSFIQEQEQKGKPKRKIYEKPNKSSNPKVKPSAADAISSLIKSKLEGGQARKTGKTLKIPNKKPQKKELYETEKSKETELNLEISSADDNCSGDITKVLSETALPRLPQLPESKDRSSATTVVPKPSDVFESNFSSSESAGNRDSSADEPEPASPPPTRKPGILKKSSHLSIQLPTRPNGNSVVIRHDSSSPTKYAGISAKAKAKQLARSAQPEAHKPELTVVEDQVKPDLTENKQTSPSPKALTVDQVNVVGIASPPAKNSINGKGEKELRTSPVKTTSVQKPNHPEVSVQEKPFSKENLLVAIAELPALDSSPPASTEKSEAMTGRLANSTTKDENTASVEISPAKINTDENIHKKSELEITALTAPTKNIINIEKHSKLGHKVDKHNTINHSKLENKVTKPSPQVVSPAKSTHPVSESMKPQDGVISSKVEAVVTSPGMPSPPVLSPAKPSPPVSGSLRPQDVVISSKVDIVMTSSGKPISQVLSPAKPSPPVSETRLQEAVIPNKVSAVLTSPEKPIPQIPSPAKPSPPVAGSFKPQDVAIPNKVSAVVTRPENPSSQVLSPAKPSPPLSGPLQPNEAASIKKVETSPARQSSQTISPVKQSTGSPASTITKPLDSAKITSPSKPVSPTKHVSPAGPMSPAKPISSAKSLIPAKSMSPAKPISSAQHNPTKPLSPAKPLSPFKPLARSVSPTKPSSLVVGPAQPSTNQVRLVHNPVILPKAPTNTLFLAKGASNQMILPKPASRPVLLPKPPSSPIKSPHVPLLLPKISKQPIMRSPNSKPTIITVGKPTTTSPSMAVQSKSVTVQKPSLSTTKPVLLGSGPQIRLGSPSGSLSCDKPVVAGVSKSALGGISLSKPPVVSLVSPHKEQEKGLTVSLEPKRPPAPERSKAPQVKTVELPRRVLEATSRQITKPVPTPPAEAVSQTLALGTTTNGATMVLDSSSLGAEGLSLSQIQMIGEDSAGEEMIYLLVDDGTDPNLALENQTLYIDSSQLAAATGGMLAMQGGELGGGQMILQGGGGQLVLQTSEAGGQVLLMMPEKGEGMPPLTSSLGVVTSADTSGGIATLPSHPSSSLLAQVSTRAPPLTSPMEQLDLASSLEDLEQSSWVSLSITVVSSLDTCLQLLELCPKEKFPIDF